MKKTLTIILWALFTSLGSYCIAQTNEEKAKEKGLEAIKLMDEGYIDRSIELLEEAEQLDPNNFAYPYEIGYAYYSMENFKKAIEQLKKAEKLDGANDLVYQLMGNSYDMQNNSKKAMEVYKRGIEKFPNSGALYLESGIVQLKLNKYEDGLSYFEKGVSVAPMHSSNYFWASKLFCDSDEEVWGLIYGELFMNLERNSKRTAEISKLLFDTYKKEITFTKDSAIHVSFSKNNTIDINNIRMPFGVGIFEPTLLLALASTKEINIETLNVARSKFIDLYYEKGLDKRYPNPLFEYQKKVKDAGHFEAYNYWVLMKGDEYEFIHWQLQNEDKWNAFIDWFSENPIQLNDDNKFIRR